MKSITSLASAVAAVACLSLLTGIPVGAQTIAAFNQASSTNSFVFKNSGATSTFDAAPTQVVFSYLVPNSYGPVSKNIDATLTMTSNVSGPAASNGPLVSQGLRNVDVMITANGMGSGNDLLSFSGAQGTLTGLDGSSTAAEFTFNPTNAMSNFLNFGSLGSTFEFTFGKNNSLTVARNGYLKSFRTAGNGQFTAVPETAGMTTVGLMLLGTGLLIGLRRRRTA